MPMHIVILADTHGVLDDRVAALARRADLVIHGGDVGNADILDELEAAADVVAVLGNNDVPAKWPRGQARRLRALPERTRIEVPGGVIAIEHGHRALPARARHDVLRKRHADARLVVYGHSHHLVIDRAAAPWIVNPGAAGRARTFGGPSCVILRAGPRTWRLDAHRFER